MAQVPEQSHDELRSFSLAYVALSEEKRREFRARIRDAGIDPIQFPIARFPDRDSRFPLSHAQERLWFMWRLDPASAAYNISGAVKLAGKLNVAAVRQALQRISLRHEALRKRFEEVDGIAWQIVGDAGYGWQEHDLSGLEDEVREQELRRQLLALARQPFDLRQGPLLQVALFRLAPDEYVLHFCVHHIVSDGWSMDLLKKEFVHAYVTTAYEGGAGAPANVAASYGVPLAIQYGDYARWQREWLDDGSLTRQLDYWTRRLGHEHPVLELPYTRRRTGLRSAEGGRVHGVLDRDVDQGLRQVARKYDTTLFVVLLAAYMLLLTRYGNQKDIRVGIPVAGRDRVDTEALIGFFVNTLVIRGEVEGLPGFEDLVAQIRARVLEAHEHQDLPFAQLVEALQPTRSFSHSPLFQAMFSYGVADRSSLTLPELTVSGLDAGLESSRFDLVLQAFDASVLSLAFNYSCDVFDKPVVQRMFDHYVELLSQIAAARGTLALGEIRLGVPDAIHAARTTYPFDPVATRIGRRAQAQPDAPAVHCEGERLTYGELDEWANRIAQRLVRVGVRREARVGLCVRRAAALPAALLGILKSGAAFVPLDPDYPADRLAYMVADAGIEHVVGDEGAMQCVAGLVGPSGIRHITLVTDVDGESALPPEVAVLPDQLAYVIYTSGSTGMPKGVAITQGALSLHLDDFIATYGITDADKQFQSSTINFDVALHEMLPALMQGGQVEMRGNRLWTLEETSRCLADQQVTFARIPTAYWQQWLRDLPRADTLAALRQITVGGEGLPGDALQRWQQSALAHVRLDNLYGPTETTVACMYRRTAPADANQPIVSIGQPYPSRSAYVMDGDANEAPIGGLGELCVGGDTVARGYLDRPALTAEKFIPDPFREDGARMYRTGDLCRQREDGDIDFLGRMDQQVKLRGFRIELGEIEAVLRAVPGVREAVVELRGEADRKRLVAYITGAAQEGAMREGVAARLPSHMAPSVYVCLDRLPLLPSGKVDRKALPEPGGIRQREALAPRSPREATLLKVWNEVLRRDDLGVADDFFEQGGDSILSLQMVARARHAGLKLTPRQLFEHPTVAGLARVAQDVAEESGYEEITETLELTPIQRTFFERFPQGLSHWNQSVLLAMPQGLEITALEHALAALVAAHDALRLRFVRDSAGRSGQWRQRVAAAETARVLAVHDLRQRDDWQCALASMGTALQAGLDIEHGPLLRAGYFILDGQARLLLAIHHLAVDGVSWRVLLEELQQGYEQAAAGQPLRLPPNTPWSVWVQRLLAHGQSEAVQAETQWWRDALAGASSQRRVPEVGRLDEGGSLVVALDEAETRQLLREAPRAYRAGVEVLLLAALAQTLDGWSTGDGLLVALEGHGREPLGQQDDLDTSRTVGWFTTQYPLCLSVRENPRDAIIAVKEQLRAVPARGMHFGLLAQQLADLPRPLVGFNYLGQFDQSLAPEGRFRFASESGGASQAPGLVSDMALDINGMIAAGRLSLRWDFRGDVLDAGRTKALADTFVQRLRVLIQHCAQAPAGATAADFPLAGLTQAQLQRLDLDLADVEDIYPATPVQQGMLFHSLLQAGAGVYVNQKRLTLRGRLQRARLRAAWEAAVARHPVLRTHFDLGQGGQALQVVHRSVALPYVEQDWSALVLARYEENLRAWMQDDVARGFDIHRAPLLRCALFLRPDGGHDLVWTDHHALLDGWSVGQLMGEVMHIYGALCRGESAALPSAPRYRDYIAWQQQQPDAREWWLGVARAHEDPALLLADGRLASAATGTVKVEESLGVEASDALREVAKKHKVTLNTVMQAAWAAVLARHGNRREVAFGITVSGRPADLPGADRMLGLFINTMPIWFGVPADAPLGAWLAALQDHNSQLRQYEHASLADVQQWLGRSSQALFDSLLVFESYPVDEKIREGDYDVGIDAVVAVEKTHYPLAIAVVPNAAVSIRWKWDRSRISDEQASRLLDDYKSMLSQLARPDVQFVGDLALPVPARPAELTLHPFQAVAARFAVRALVAGSRRAVVCDGQSLSYAQLDAWSNRIARRLQKRGVGPDLRVGIHLARSPAVIAAVLGVMKSGAAFVPLDPELPQARLQGMVDDAGIGWIVADGNGNGLVAEHGTVAVDDVDDESAAPIDIAVHPEQLAYVIYTSGSTGKPKGVAISHGALSHHLNDFLATYRITDADRQLQSSTLAFDVALHEMLPALLQGGEVVMRGPRPWDFDSINRHLVEYGVTFARIPTAYWQRWLREPADPARLALRQITVGGEALPGDALAQWQSGPLSHIRLDNLYGPTETTVACMYRETTPVDIHHVASPIGAPFPSRTAFVVDPYGNEAPVGGLGELCMGGATVARGYVERPGLTAERFVPDPFDGAGGRLYRTGDLCRRQEDGTIEFLGRIDQQVKLRGFRIELGEVEMALRAQPGVRAAAAELRGAASDPRLVGYIVGEAQADAVRGALTAVLPAYMVPAIIVKLMELPALPSGKIDRKALPDPEQTGRARHGTGPATQMEAQLLSIWREVLQRDDIGTRDDFFQSGGDSLKALTVASLASRHGIAAFSLESLFVQPTVAALAAHLDAQSPGIPSNLFPLNAPGGRLTLFAVHPGYGLVAEYRALARRLEGVATVYGIQSPLYTEAQWWPASLVETAQDYVRRLRQVQPHGPYHLLGWSSGGWIAREMAFVLEAMGEEVAFLGLVDASPRDAQAMEEIARAVSGRAVDAVDADPRAVREDEIDALLRTMQEDAERWQAVVPGGEAGRYVLEQAIRVGKHFAVVETSGHAGGQRAPLSLWFANGNAAPVDGYLARWRSVSAGEATLVQTIHTDHAGIIRHPAFLDSVHGALSSLRSGLHA
ncbi:non-ribosomal peptide synthetase [Bordetella sp. LUAb4]|uniref:non-ribosomal peptide synthetase n=1 Tax=Bordetella sp. LUAb4 TaxID=2843195 RepID=UPI001E2F3D80|nr:non-ribosomal peptide synthetase [Bordetella sp. LUAb4]